MDDAPRARIARARASLEALATGDAFGEQFFREAARARQAIATRKLPEPPWPFTDDTVMAVSIVDVLERHATIDQDALARLFATRYRLDPSRGYGEGAHHVLGQLSSGRSWREVSSRAFDGSGSMGNGGAMRSAPVGAFFCDDFEGAALQGARSAEVTHAHAEGRAGAVAVAVAAACTARGVSDPDGLFAAVIAHTPPSATRAAIERAAALPRDVEVAAAVGQLGNGSRALAQDTVPFCLWCVARHLGEFEEGLWATVAGLGDRDTTCAIVAGILGAAPGVAPPPAWVASREPLAAASPPQLHAGDGRPGGA